MLSTCPTATKSVYVVLNLWLLSVCLIMVHFYLQFFLKGSAYIVGKLVMHPCVPFRGGAPPTFFGAPWCAPCSPVEEHCSKHYLSRISLDLG